MKKYILISLPLAIALILIQSIFFTRTVSTKESTANQPGQRLARLSSETTAEAVGKDNPLINLSSGRSLLTSYFGSSNAQLALAQNSAHPTVLAAADLDEDGTADLVAGYAGPSGGIVTIHRGNVDAIYPNSPEAKQRKAEHSFTESPFLAPALVLDLPEAPDFLATGDFDADGHWDLAVAANSSSSLYLLPGDGHGNFSSPKRVNLPGRVTALTCGEINRADGLTDIAVAIAGEQGPQVLVFEGPQGALRSAPEALKLPAPAAQLVLGRLNADYLFDLAAAGGPALMIVEGRDRKLSLDAALQSDVAQPVIKQQSLGFVVSSMSVGNFDDSAGEELALLAADGTLHLLTRPEENAVEKKASNDAGWSSKRLSNVLRPGASLLMAARVSSTGGDDLLIADSANNQLHIVTNEIGQGLREKTLNVEGGAAAVLAMRLNSDAMSDLVILRSNQVAPTVVASTQGPQAVFTVTNTNDGGAGSLRNAITLANLSTGADLIDFNIAPGGSQTIIPLTTLPTITDPVTIDGTTQPGFNGTPVIELNGSSLPNGSNGLFITGGNTTVRGLVINRFGGSGDAIEFQMNGGNVVEGNFIGTDVTGAVGLVNGAFGVFVNGPSNNRIGGTTAAARNVISGHGRGIFLSGTSSTITTGNLVQGNFIGTNATGTAALGNSVGVQVFRAVATVGGTVAEARNIISGNITGILFNSTSGTLVQGNLIGTDVTGALDLGNSLGVQLPAGNPNNTVGGTTPAARNIVSGSDIFGFQIRGAGTDGNLVQGNFIGTNAQGTAAIGNVLDGVSIESSSNTIGGATDSARNIISGNGRDGISIFTNTGITVQNNFIGTDLTGNNCLGNGRDGIFVNNGSVGHTIADNLITCNGRNGVNIPNVPTNDPGIRIAVTDNFIFANGALGIDLGDPGITPNDPLDADGGANLQQNFPVLTSFTSLAPSDGTLPLQPDSAQAAVTVSATLNSTPNSDFTVHWYFSADAQCAMNQQASQPLVFGRRPVTTGADGNAPFNFQLDLPAGITSGIVNCTATDSLGNTSEFSACLQVTAAPPPNTVQFTSSTANASETLNATTKVDLNVTRSGSTSGPATVNYASSDGTANDRSDYLAALGTLRFAAGETTKTISVFIVDDRFGEGAETFNVTLSNPVGLVLGSPASVTVTINSNEAVDGGNPVQDPNFNTDFFVRQHYLDFLNREADPPGLAFWKNEIDPCETLPPAEIPACRRRKRIIVSGAFFLSIEFQQTGYLVERLYKSAYGDAVGTSTIGGAHQLPVPIVQFTEFLPDSQTIGQGVIVNQTGWEALLENNKQAFIAEFVQRSRFTTAFPTALTPAQFVDALFTNTGVTPSASERTSAINEFGGASTSADAAARARALRRVAENGTFTQQEGNRAFVLMQYFGYMRRTPNSAPDSDHSGYEFWLTKLNDFGGNFVDADMVEAFITSGEYIHRFGP